MLEGPVALQNAHHRVYNVKSTTISNKEVWGIVMTRIERSTFFIQLTVAAVPGVAGAARLRVAFPPRLLLPDSLVYVIYTHIHTYIYII